LIGSMSMRQTILVADVSTKLAANPHRALYPRLTPEALFTEARRMAGADRALVAQIDRAPARQSRGRVGGAIVHDDKVNARAADNYTIAFRGGELAMIVDVRCSYCLPKATDCNFRTEACTINIATTIEEWHRADTFRIFRNKRFAGCNVYTF